MAAERKSFEERWTLELPVVFGVIVACFVAAMLFTQWQMMSVGRSSLEIADGTAPSIEELASARGEMRHLEVLLADYVDAAKSGQKPSTRGIELTRQAMNESFADYLVLPVEPNEQRLWGDILRTKDAFEGNADRTLAAANAGQVADAATSLKSLDASGDAFGAAITRDIELNAQRSHALALSIASAQKRSMLIAFALAALCAAITVGGAAALRRVMRQRAALAEERRRLIEARATELDQFAGRVAHDILSPLGTVGLALQTTTMSGLDDARRTQLAERGTSAIKRIERLVSGLLAFAVAGALPEEGAHADVQATIADLERELRDAASSVGAELSVDVKVSHFATCNPGVLMSIVSNLAHNAVKYIGDSATRRIAIRAYETRSAIRLEVQDTGPGLPPDLEPRVFEPYVRGHGSKTAGIGLGLATVKRVTVAHGGRAGVKSVVGSGCTFWVELPKGAETAPSAPDQPVVVH